MRVGRFASVRICRDERRLPGCRHTPVVKFWAFMILIYLPGFVLLSVLATRFSRRRSKGRYVSGGDRLWNEHPEWIVIAVLAGLVLAILTVR